MSYTSSARGAGAMAPGSVGAMTIEPVTARAEALASRLEQGARQLIELAAILTKEQWQMRIPKDGRKIGVVVNHVGFMYPLEIELAQKLAEGQPITGVTWDDVHAINARHAEDNDDATKEASIELVRRNSGAAAAAIRALSDEELDRGATISMYADAPLTCQFMLEDHAVRHSYHHLAKIRATLGL